MNVAQQKRRRDWSLIILILPLGLVMMMCVGQQAIRMSPTWSVDGDMKSSLDPESAPKQDALIVPPISNDILTPVTWWDTFLTPSDNSGGGVVVFPPFITFEPSATPSATASASVTPPTSTITITSVVTGTPPPPTSTPTKKPTDDVTATPPTATSTTTSTTTSTATSTATSTTTSTTTSTSTSTTTATSTATATSITSTPVGTQTAVPPQVTVGTPDGSLGIIDDGDYIVLNLTLSGTPIVVTNPSDTNYEMVYYERATGGGVDMDSVIISISMDNVIYYVVFHWGDNQPNDHTNVDVNDLPPPPSGCTDLECDNQHIDAADLHDPDGGGPVPDTGILIDVDNAPSNPPPGDYWYVAVQAPSPPPPPPVVPTDGADVDSIEIVDIAPTP